MGGFEVIPEALDAAGAAMEPIGAELPVDAQTTAGPVHSAAAANPGFFISEAIGYAYTQIERAVQGAATDIRQYGKNLGTVADRYARVDQDAAASLKDIEGAME